MSKKLLTMVLFMFILIMFSVNTLGSDLTLPRNQEYDMKVPCLTENNSLCGSGTVCILTILYNTKETIISNDTMSYNPTFFNYTISANNLTKEGVYNTYINCITPNGEYPYDAFNFQVTNSGNAIVSNNIFSVGVMVFLLFITIIFIYLSMKKISDNKYINFIARRSFLIVSVFLMMWDSSIIADIAKQTGLDVNSPMFAFMEIFGWIGYVSIVILILDFVIRTMNQYKIDKKKRRYGDQE